jgi:3-hydroxybutyryl-CoA dehydrogenase
VIATIGVIGAGQMGGGIVQICAQHEYRVKMLDITQDALDSGLAIITRNLKRQYERGAVTSTEMDAALGRIAIGLDYSMFTDCDVVIEAASENENIKREILTTLTASLKPDALVVSNTSSISITRLASYTDRPERFMGMHFMYPVPRMEFVELIRGLATSDKTYEEIFTLAEALDKTVAEARDFPAFIINRILLPMINEAIYTLHEGVGGIEAIDTALRTGANHPMGPLELADFIGLDTCLAVMRVLHDGLGDSKYRPCPLLVMYVEAGWLGRKTKRGFYDYSGDTPVPTR